MNNRKIEAGWEIPVVKRWVKIIEKFHLKQQQQKKNGVTQRMWCMSNCWKIEMWTEQKSSTSTNTLRLENELQSSSSYQGIEIEKKESEKKESQT